MTADASWVGLAIGDYLVEEQLGAGVFSEVYLATHQVSGKKYVLKSARASDSAAPAGRTNWYATRAYMQITGAIGEAKPDTVELLKTEYRKLKSTKNDGLIAVHDFVQKGPLNYYLMDYVEGQSFQHLLSDTHASDRRVFCTTVLAVADVMTQLAGTTFGDHSDLKPENIIVGGAGKVTLIDPGYFGHIKMANSKASARVSVTTPQYYPQMRSDDLLALGIVLWQAATGVNPFTTRCSLENVATNLFSDDLIEVVRMSEFTGNYFYSSILNLPAMRDSVTVSPALGSVLLKALRVTFNDGKLSCDHGFADFADFSSALAKAIS